MGPGSAKKKYFAGDFWQRPKQDQSAILGEPNRDIICLKTTPKFERAFHGQYVSIHSLQNRGRLLVGLQTINAQIENKMQSDLLFLDEFERMNSRIVTL